MEKVSIIIPLYNTEKWIGEIIDSILAQTYTNWELIIVDDGSTDNSIKVVSEYKDERIKIIHRERLPKGAPTCRNIGFTQAQGKYVVFLDSDDLLLPYALEQRVKAIEENGGSDFAIGGCKAFIQGESINQALSKNRYIYGLFKGDPLSLLLKSKYPFIVCTNIYKKSSLIKNNIIWDEDIKVFQDFRFNFKVLNSGLTHQSVSPFLIDYLYRVGHSASNISKEFISEDKFQSTINLINETLSDISIRTDYKKRKAEFIGFMVNYYLKLLTNGTKKQRNLYLKYCRQHYGSYTLGKFKILNWISILIPQFTFKMDLLKLAVFFLYGIKII